MLQQRRTIPILGSRSFWLAACATAVSAQQVPPAEASGKRNHSLLEEVVVTAQKRQQSANDVAIAISAFTGDQLEALGISDTRDLSALVPGFVYADSGFNTPTYTLRGVGFNEASQTASSTVGVYLDEFNLPFPVMTKGANLDLSRVEVLKGPQGTLYGRNTTGGAINYIAEKPSDNFEASVEASYSSFKTHQLSGMLSGPLAEGLRGRLAIRGIQSDQGWQTSLTRPGDRLGRKDKLSGRGILEWDLSDSLRMRLSLDSWRDNSEPQAPQAVYIRPQNPILGELGLSPEVSSHPLVSPNTNDARVADWPARPPLDRSFRLNDQFDMLSFRVDQDLFDNTTFTLLASSARFESDSSVLPQSGTSVEYLTDRIIDVDTEAHQVEARFSGTLGAEINWVSGVFYSLDEVSEYQDYFTGKVSAVFPTPLGPTIADRLVLLGEQDAETQAVFGNMDLPLSANFRLSAGARYTREVREFAGCSADSPGRSQGVGFGPVFTAIGATNIDSLDDLLGLLESLSDGSVVDNVSGNGGCFTANVETAQPGLARPPELDEDNVSGRLALDWTPNDGTLVYTSYSRGYKSGSFPVLSSSRSDQYEPAIQERLDAYEVGAKSTLWSGSMQLNLAAFYYDYQDKQLLTALNDPFFGPLPVLDNAPESKVTGAEADIVLSPIENLALTAALSYLDTEIIKFESVNRDGNDQDFAGDPFNFAPRWSYRLGINYELPIGNAMILALGADYAFTDETNSVLGNDPRFHHDAYHIANIRAALSQSEGRWQATLWGRNITDEYYVQGVFNPGDTIGRYTGMPRTYGVSVQYHYF